MRHQEVVFTQAHDIMGGPSNAHFVKDIEPIRVVIVLLSELGYLSHETKGLHKISKDKLALDGFCRCITLPQR